MKEGRTKRALINSVISIVTKLLLTIAPFAVRTAMIRSLGIEYLGLNSLFSSILGMLNLTEMGFGSAIIFSMYKPMADGNIAEVSGLLNFYKGMYRLVGLVIVIAGSICIPFLQCFISSDYPPEINIYLVYIIYLINTSLSYFLFAYKNSVLIANMRNDVDSIVTTSCQLLMYSVQVFLLFTMKNYYVYIIVLPITTLANNIIKSVIVDRMYPQLDKKIKVPKSKRRDILSRVGALVGNKIGGVVFSSVDSIVISVFLGLTILGRYSNYYMVFTSVAGMVSIVFSSIQAVIGNKMVSNSVEENYSVFKELVFINGWITVLCTCCFAVLYQPFIEIWVGRENLLPLDIAILLSFYYFVRGIRQVCFTYKEAAGMWREDFLKPYISVAVNLSLNIILVKLIGLPGVIISSVVALLFIEIPWETHVFFKLYFGKKSRDYILMTVKFFVVVTISIPVLLVIQQLIPITIGGLVVRIGLCVIIPNLVFFPLFIKNEELYRVKNRIKLIKRR